MFIGWDTFILRTFGFWELSLLSPLCPLSPFSNLTSITVEFEKGETGETGENRESCKICLQRPFKLKINTANTLMYIYKGTHTEKHTQGHTHSHTHTHIHTHTHTHTFMRCFCLSQSSLARVRASVASVHSWGPSAWWLWLLVTYAR